MSYAAGPLARARHTGPAPASEQPVAWSERTVAAVESRWPWVLAGMLALDLVLLLYMGRGLSFYYDEWEFILREYGGGLHLLLLPHVGNISIFPILSYKLLFHVAGLNHYAVYRLVVIVLHLLAACLIFVCASRRVSRAPALLATALILFLGAAWEDLLWGFQVGYMLSIVGGLAAWVLLDREERRGDVAAMLCLVLASGSSSLGIALMAGIAVELAWRRQWSRIFVAAVPLALYLLWYAGYGDSQVTAESLIHAPGFAEDLAAAAFGALIGRALEWGRPLALLGTLALLARLVRPIPVSARLAGLIATALVLWIVTAFARSTISPPEAGRYTYLGAVAIVLIGVELLAGMKIGARALVVAAPLVALFAVTGLTVMRGGAVGWRETSETVTAELGALQLAGAYAPPDYRPDPVLAPPVFAGAYLHTVRSIGSSPADAPAQIAAANPTARAAADRVLLALEAPKLTAVARGGAVPAGTAPHVSMLVGRSATPAGACVALRPSLGAMTAMLALPPGGALIRDDGRAGATVLAKRFADGFSPIAGTAAPGLSTLMVSPDASSTPWQVLISSSSPLAICALQGRPHG
jgi:hypothetical protein